MLPKYRIIAGIGINLLGGVVVLYAFGIVGMMVRGHMSFVAAWSANAAFINLVQLASEEPLRGESLARRCEHWLIGAKARLDAARQSVAE